VVTRRNRVLAWLAAGILILSLTSAGMIISLGRFQGPDAAATVPAGGSATTLPIDQSAPSIGGAFSDESEMGDGVGDGGFQTRTSIPSHAATAPTPVTVTTGPANGG
jgi:hypothetical protein